VVVAQRFHAQVGDPGGLSNRQDATRAWAEREMVGDKVTNDVREVLDDTATPSSGAPTTANTTRRTFLPAS